MNKENALLKLLAKLEAQPLAKERKEFGYFLMRHIDDLSPSELTRYKELELLLSLPKP